MLLHNAFRISKTACIRDPPLLDGEIPVTAEQVSEACETALLAPQAELIGAIISGIFGGDFNLPMVLIGVVIACIIIWKKMPVMSVAIGIYLPLFLSVPIIVGGLIHFFVSRITHYRIDGTLEGDASERAEETAKKVTDKGVLIGAGFIAGESLMGVLIAFFIVTFQHPKDWFDSITQLGQTLSLVFYGCFVAIFAFLATRSIPRVEGHSFLTDFFSVITDAGRRFIESVRPR
jgi:hypothetical protein